MLPAAVPTAVALDFGVVVASDAVGFDVVLLRLVLVGLVFRSRRRVVLPAAKPSAVSLDLGRPAAPNRVGFDVVVLGLVLVGLGLGRLLLAGVLLVPLPVATKAVRLDLSVEVAPTAVRFDVSLLLGFRLPGFGFGRLLSPVSFSSPSKLPRMPCASTSACQFPLMPWASTSSCSALVWSALASGVCFSPVSFSSRFQPRMEWASVSGFGSVFSGTGCPLVECGCGRAAAGCLAVDAVSVGFNVVFLGLVLFGFGFGRLRVAGGLVVLPACLTS